jgi:hypothetical protein
MAHQQEIGARFVEAVLEPPEIEQDCARRGQCGARALTELRDPLNVRLE